MNTIDSDTHKRLLQRPIINQKHILEIIKPIIENVRENKDRALLSYTAKLDHVANLSTPVLLPPFTQYFKLASSIPSLSTIDSQSNYQNLFNVLSIKVKEAIDTVYQNTLQFHESQLEKQLTPITANTTTTTIALSNINCSRYTRPIERIGIYVPGGTTILSSTALMLGIPAKVAGCSTIVIATPPRPDGTVSPEILYIADKLGVAQIVMASGAQAIAAMAYGTESVFKVDKICGPGDQYITAAKILCQSDMSALLFIDLPTGPSEVLIIADQSANPAFVVADLLAQAEHGPDSHVLLLLVIPDASQSLSLIERIQCELKKQVLTLPRLDIIGQSIAHGYIIETSTIEEALAFSNEYAPGHLILNFNNAEQYIDAVRNAGSIFVGPWTPESYGGYASGISNTSPTYGYARTYSSVSTSTFLKHITTQTLTEDGLRQVANCVVTLAESENLHAHARAVSLRVNPKQKLDE